MHHVGRPKVKKLTKKGSVSRITVEHFLSEGSSNPVFLLEIQLPGMGMRNEMERIGRNPEYVILLYGLDRTFVTNPASGKNNTTFPQFSAHGLSVSLSDYSTTGSTGSFFCQR